MYLVHKAKKVKKVKDCKIKEVQTKRFQLLAIPWWWPSINEKKNQTNQKSNALHESFLLLLVSNYF